MLKRLAALALLLPTLALAWGASPRPTASAVDVTMPSAAATKAALDREVPRLLAEHSIPSISIAQVRHGRVVLTAAYGFQSAGAPATVRTLYNIASLTKPLTADVVLRLASKGQLSLDEPMYRYWTDPDIATDPRRMLLTPRLSLSHQTGFPNWRDRKTGLRFKRDPGVKFGYSGEGYEYLGRFVEKKTGRPFEALAQTLLFDPVGMKDTSFTGKPWFEGRIAIPADAKGQPLAPEIGKDFSAADLVYTTPSDYAAFLIAVWKDKGLTPTIAHERQRIQVSTMDNCTGPEAATCPPELGFGLGWEVARFPHDILLLHNGHDNGVYTVAYLDKNTGDGAVFFMNGQNGPQIAPEIVDLLGACPECLGFLKVEI